MIKRLLLLVILLLPAFSAYAQTPSIVGTWALTGADKILPDGTRVSDFGASPHGLVIFTADGHYAVEISGDKLKGTAEEYKDAPLAGSTVYRPKTTRRRYEPMK
jgi:hypothetical protein